MKFSVENQSFVFQGSLDESTPENSLISEFQKLRLSLGSKPLSVDFTDVLGANSNGIVSWLRFIESARHPLSYRGVPVWMVGQFNMIDRFFAFGSFVESMAVPFYSAESNESEVVILRVGADIEIRNCYRDFNLGPRTFRGKIFEMDCEPERYFQFLSTKCEQFKADQEKN
jgi:hypothetical protein